MKTVFADSYYFLAALNERDDGHSRVMQFSESYRGQMITTEWVLAEVGDAFAKPIWRPSFVTLMQQLQDNPRVTIVEATHIVFGQAVQLFASRSDKEWSITDCTSFVVMENHDVTEALTADHHFEQAGFAALFA